MAWTRRRVIFVGAGGALALVGLAVFGLRRWRNGPPPTGSALLAGKRPLFAAVTVALLGPALATEPTRRAAELVRVETAAARLLDNLPPGTRREFADLLEMLAFAPARSLLGYSGAWSEAAAADIAHWLAGLRASTFAPKAQIYFALHDLVFGGHYADPAAWTAFGYPGPPWGRLGLAERGRARA